MSCEAVTLILAKSSPPIKNVKMGCLADDTQAELWVCDYCFLEVGNGVLNDSTHLMDERECIVCTLVLSGLVGTVIAKRKATIWKRLLTLGLKRLRCVVGGWSQVDGMKVRNCRVV